MKDDLGDRMKGYESVTKTKLMKRVPVIVRVDGKAFHNFCKRFDRPYDEVFNGMMNKVLQKLCAEVQGVKLGERHSDELSLLITDYDSLNTTPYFDYSIQKMVSVISSIATAELCRQLVLENNKHAIFSSDWSGDINPSIKPVLFMDETWPSFDARCFNIPEREISNYFWWRNNDSVRNSIQMLAQSEFSHKELQGMGCDAIQDKLFKERGINWNNIDQGQKTGFICTSEKFDYPVEKGPNKGDVYQRSQWILSPAPKTLDELRRIVENVTP